MSLDKQQAAIVRAAISYLTKLGKYQARITVQKRGYTYNGVCAVLENHLCRKFGRAVRMQVLPGLTTYEFSWNMAREWDQLRHWPGTSSAYPIEGYHAFWSDKPKWKGAAGKRRRAYCLYLAKRLKRIAKKSSSESIRRPT